MNHFDCSPTVLFWSIEANLSNIAEIQCLRWMIFLFSNCLLSKFLCLLKKSVILIASILTADDDVTKWTMRRLLCDVMIVWYGTTWYGRIWYCMVWCDMIWYGVVWYGMVWHGMVWYGMVWYGMFWHDMVVTTCIV